MVLHFYIDMESCVNSENIGLSEMLSWSDPANLNLFPSPLALIHLPSVFSPCVPCNLEITQLCEIHRSTCLTLACTLGTHLQMFIPLFCLPLSRLPPREIAVLLAVWSLSGLTLLAFKIKWLLIWCSKCFLCYDLRVFISLSYGCVYSSRTSPY